MWKEAIIYRNILSSGTVLALAFNPNGDLYIAESDTRNTYYVRLIDTAGKITHFAGKLQPRDRKCQCSVNATTATPVRNSRDLPDCPCSIADDTTNNAETLLSSNAAFQTISAISVSPGGVLYIADQGGCVFYYPLCIYKETVWHTKSERSFWSLDAVCLLFVYCCLFSLWINTFQLKGWFEFIYRVS